MADAVDSAQWMAYHGSGTHSSRFSGKSTDGRGKFSGAAGGSGPAPMELGMAASDRERKQPDHNEMKCYKCGQKGHIRRNCPNKGKLNAVRGAGVASGSGASSAGAGEKAETKN